jgi:hypothetical protein
VQLVLLEYISQSIQRLGWLLCVCGLLVGSLMCNTVLHWLGSVCSSLDPLLLSHRSIGQDVVTNSCVYVLYVSPVRWVSVLEIEAAGSDIAC